MRILTKEILNKAGVWNDTGVDYSGVVLKYLNNKFVAVGSSNNVAISDYGVNWEIKTFGTPNWINVFQYKNYFMLVGNDGRYILTTDFESTYKSAYNSLIPVDAVTDNNIMVAVGQNLDASVRNYIITYSALDFTPTSRQIGPATDFYWHTIMYDGTQYIAVGYDSSTAKSRTKGTYITTRGEGRDWDTPFFVTENGMNATYYNGMVYFYYGSKFYRTDDVTKSFSEWETITTFGGSISKCCFIENSILTNNRVSVLSSVSYSENFINNDVRKSSVSSEELKSIACDNNKFVCLTNNNKIKYKYF